MNAKNTNKLLKKNGNTKDIATAVIQVYNSDYLQAKELAESLQDNTTALTCENIFNHLIDNVNYIEDPNGVQWVKTPARLMADGTGDCKSMAIFIASCLRCLGINHVFRFVSFSSRKEATHVYVVAFDEQGKEIIIDPVVRVEGLPKFNFQEKYTYKSDMNGTNIYYLAGIRKGAIGASTIDETERYKVWIGDEKEFEVTPGKHYLYAQFDLTLEMINITSNKKELAAQFDLLDVYASLLHSYNHVNGDTVLFKKIAKIVCGLISEGLFTSPVTDENERSNRLDDLFAEILGRYQSGYTPEIVDSAIWEMLETEVFPYNELAKISGLSADETYALEQFKRSGIYFIYKFIPDDISNYPSIIAKKLGYQDKTFNWAAERNTMQTPAGTLVTLRAGVIARTGKTPERYIEDQKNKAAGIGFDPITIMAVISLITALVKLIQLIFPPKYQYSQPTDAEFQAGAIDPTTDFLGSKITSNSSNNTGVNTSNSVFQRYGLEIAIGAIALLFLFKNKD